ncbi:cytochrome c oxidase assembly protein [Nocardioides sp. T2.26MG-1]|uniref:cytochrome c oxidase assembly protein n=1 Tax=Nocardioides sp. T2.26MG-1 TaxID=3041166 RepID=UPI00254150AA|nr:cytochrome c oxidase assembly protein [Nocardioides sp. T2.26MG-1]
MAAGLVTVAPLVSLMLLVVTGGTETSLVPGLPDAGELTRYGLPLTQALRDVAAAVTVGALALTVLCVPPGSPEDREGIGGARRALLDLVVVAASTWTWSGFALLGFVYSDAAGVPLTSPGFVEEVTFFGRSFELGRYLVVSSSMGAVVAVGALVVRRINGVGILAALAVAGLWPMALTGHAAGSLNHDDAVNLQAMHLIGVSVWAGGLVALIVVRPRLGESLLPTVKRYSALAGWCLAVVAVSGLLGAFLRLPSLADVTSTYGALLGIKVAAATVVAGFGWWQRQVGIRRLAQGRQRAFARMVVIEIGVLAAASGTGVALSRTPPPAPPGAQEPLTAAQSLLGRELPPPLGAAEWLTQWEPDSFWLPIALLLLASYAAAVARLRSRGDRWPLSRTVAWTIGWVLFIWATSGSPGAYGRVLFSMHMVQHMTVALAVPAFLVMGAPVTLALRTLSRRADGSMGPREWLMRIVHSWPARLLGSPIVAAGMVIVSLAVFYYSSLFELSLRTHTAHLLMTAHFLISGYLFANCLVGVDPGPRRPAYPLRVLLILVTFGFHALFSVSLMANNKVLARDWFAPLDRTWGGSLIDDQYLGASLGWALGDYPLAILAMALIVSWVRADRRERLRFDRKARRDGDQELTAYNDYLARLRSESTLGRSGTAHTESDQSEGDRTP